MKRVLIITYYWPPSGGSGVQRWLKYARYLPEYGWQPVIYTPENPEAPATDSSLLAEVPLQAEIIRRPITEPYQWYKKITGRRESVNVGFIRTEAEGSESRAELLSRWVRGNFFIPDARCLWIRPSVRFLQHYLRENPVEAIISTGPPHSMHRIAQQLARKTGLPWLADFRDPWTGIDFYADLLLTQPADRLHRRMERSVLSQADVVTTVSGSIRGELLEKGARRAEVIPNGYDPADFAGLSTKVQPASDYFTLTHSGSLVPSRNPRALWEALAKLCRQLPDFRAKLRIRLVGSVDSSVRVSVQEAGLDGNCTFIPYLPHQQALEEVFSADVLLLLINNTANAGGFLSGKVFEYMASGRPILCIGPENGDAAALLQETGSGLTHGFSDTDGITLCLEKWFTNWQHGRPSVQPSAEAVRSYTRPAQAAAIGRLLEELTASQKEASLKSYI
ncbi:MAG: glycosyltransferase family 4 protein [Candidatus Cyclonatronum sp.]|uniref:glycosyltransferase family 4 protein n=1 Tax=Cyclonatronum sp. TaxID=3024185 RepID=UPI0025C52254|nr:glycosyltransferase family 4 protein [Cyclonatronum sp.]MCH8487247.1 glycosyltransferase family 4 protein [Cyclonatronum sp.]